MPYRRYFEHRIPRFWGAFMMTILIRGIVNNIPGCCKMSVASWGSACMQQPLHTVLPGQVSADHTHEAF